MRFICERCAFPCRFDTGSENPTAPEMCAYIDERDVVWKEDSSENPTGTGVFMCDKCKNPCHMRVEGDPITPVRCPYRGAISPWEEIEASTMSDDEREAIVMKKILEALARHAAGGE